MIQKQYKDIFLDFLSTLNKKVLTYNATLLWRAHA